MTALTLLTSFVKRTTLKPSAAGVILVYLKIDDVDGVGGLSNYTMSGGMAYIRGSYT